MEINMVNYISKRNIKRVLSLLKYDKHKWIICMNLKMINFYLVNKEDIKNIYIFYACKITENKYRVQKIRPVRESLASREKNVINQLLVE